MTSDQQIYTWTSHNRVLIADVLASLDDADWNAATLCSGWTVRHLAAHLTQPMLVSFPRFFLTAIRYRGDTGKTVDHFTRRLARKPPAQLIALLRDHAADEVSPLRVGPMGPFAETCIHLRDIARPLGLTADVPVDHWRTLLECDGRRRPSRRRGRPARASSEHRSTTVSHRKRGIAVMRDRTV